MAEATVTPAPARALAPEPVGGESPAIHTVGLTKTYGSTVALAGLSMSVPRGEVFGFLGPNGAGKTTTVKLLLGLARATRGEGMVLGSPLGSLEARRGVGYLPELFRYQAWLTAREVLALHLELARVERSEWRDGIARALRTVGLQARADDRVRTFSKGMQQRLGLGVALLGRPRLVLLDEPTSALDPVGRHDVREVIRGLREQGVAVFLNSHLLSEVEQVCDRVAIVDHGRVVAEGRLQELLQGSGVRVQCEGLGPVDLERLGRFGRPHMEAGWLVLRGASRERVPELVAEIVSLGGRVYAVDPGRESLEDHFLHLVEPR